MDAFFNSIGYASWGLHFLLWFPVAAMFILAVAKGVGAVHSDPPR